jgi:hypothetical protein
MAEAKTKQTAASVSKFIESVPDAQQRKDSYAIIEMMKRATKMEPKMWGTASVGFGSVHYKYDSGREGDICMMGFSPRKQNISLYLPGGQSAYANELSSLGKHKLGKGCIYISRLSEVDQAVLQKIFNRGPKLSDEK